MTILTERMRALRERGRHGSEFHNLRERGRSPRDCGARLRRRRKHRPRSADASRQPLQGAVAVYGAIDMDWATLVSQIAQAHGR